MKNTFFYFSSRQSMSTSGLQLVEAKKTFCCIVCVSLCDKASKLFHKYRINIKIIKKFISKIILIKVIA